MNSEKHRILMILFVNDFSYSGDKKFSYLKDDFQILDRIVNLLNKESLKTLGF